MGDIQAGLADDRRTKFADYLGRRLRWWESEDDIKRSTLASYREAIELYLKPGLGHLRRPTSGTTTSVISPPRCGRRASAGQPSIASWLAALPPSVPALCQTEAKMIAHTRAGTLPVRQSSCSAAAEARGFEPRMGANPNRISSAAP
jgi:hypothetical protein